MRLPHLIVAALFALLFLASCATSVSPNTYSVGAVGQVNRTISGTIISARPVDISGTTAVGGASGAAIGATAGSSIGSGDRANIIGAIGGAIIGGIAGASIEQGATKQTGIEYVVQTENSNLMTVVQGDSPSFAVGAKVLVLYGTPSRIIADPRH